MLINSVEFNSYICRERKRIVKIFLAKENLKFFIYFKVKKKTKSTNTPTIFLISKIRAKKIDIYNC